MGGKRVGPDGVDQEWFPGGVGEVFVLVMPNGSRLLQVVKHFEDATHWGSGEPPLSVAAGVSLEGLPCWYMRQLAGQ